MWNEAGFINSNQYIKIQSYPDEAPPTLQKVGKKAEIEMHFEYLSMDIKQGMTIS